MLKDLRYGIRSLLKRPGLTAVALVTLALGIGVNTAIFSAVDSVLLRPLPFKDADRVVAIWEHTLRIGIARNEVAPLTIAGLVIGIAIGLAVTRLMTDLLFGVTATDAVTFLSVGGLLVLVALLACYIPARRATRIDPLVALRYE